MPEDEPDTLFFTIRRTGPEPFTVSTVFEFYIAADCKVKAELTGAGSGESHILVDAYMRAGKFYVEINAADLGLSPGVYNVSIRIISSSGWIFMKDLTATLIKDE